ncbi:hypothetical protein PW716_001301 [Salmonella enterica]|nr:hypothetical protein [Salmonella enterica]
MRKPLNSQPGRYSASSSARVLRPVADCGERCRRTQNNFAPSLRENYYVTLTAIDRGHWRTAAKRIVCEAAAPQRETIPARWLGYGYPDGK